MDTIGIVCEYNPFHNGHLYHINKIKEMYPISRIILILSGPFLERGDVSLLNKWDKTKIALEHNIDLVVELPFVFASQSADIFAHGAIQIMKHMKINKIVFGSELNQISVLEKCAKSQISEEYDNLLKEYLNTGINYPNAVSKSMEKMGCLKVDSPNDLLGISYIKEIIKENAPIDYISIKRTNSYHDSNLNKNISSASSIRLALKDGLDIKKYVPINTYHLLNNYISLENYYPLIKYKILSENELSKYQTVDEGIEYLIKKHINSSSSLEELIIHIKSKRYTYNRLKRMFVHILCDFTKNENSRCKDIRYIRVLGFNSIGRKYLNTIKKDSIIPIITGYSNIKDEMLDIEYRVNSIYACIYNKKSKELINLELGKPIIKS